MPGIPKINFSSRKNLIEILILLVVGGGSYLYWKHQRTLYNGIVLPYKWPPQTNFSFQDITDPPYLKNLPSPILIDIGRQLFVDDFLIESTDLIREFHAATPYERNPVLIPDKKWEIETETEYPVSAHQKIPPPNATAIPYSDGLWYDPSDQLFKVWYMSGYEAHTAMATSIDGIHWDKPALNVVPGTNLVQIDGRDSSSVILDFFENDPKRRFKMFKTGPKNKTDLHFSSDGIHWEIPFVSYKFMGDRNSFFYNPFRDQWVFSLRDYTSGGARIRKYFETANLTDNFEGASRWIAADNQDNYRAEAVEKSQLYNLELFAYESLIVGLFNIWHGQPSDRPKLNDIQVGFSRDGFYWDRTSRQPFLSYSNRFGDWNWGNVSSVGGGCLVVGDRLYFYYAGRKGVRGSKKAGTHSLGLAFLRRDGFASMNAGTKEGTLTTRLVKFSGNHLFVNADMANGKLLVEILDQQGHPISPYLFSNCEPMRINSTIHEIRWVGGSTLDALKGKMVKFHFKLRNGKIYSFWVSPNPNGASGGYVAAGGPGFEEGQDHIGIHATKASLNQMRRMHLQKKYVSP